MAEFNPNGETKGPGIGKAMFPSAEGMPYDVQSYVEMFKNQASALMKGDGINVPPSSTPYLNLSYMPDLSNSGVAQIPGIPPESLAKIASENISPQLIIGMRVADVLSYANLSRHAWKRGWRIIHREAERNPTKEIKKDIVLAENFIMNCNTELTGSERDKRGYTSFRQFLAMLVRASLIMDGMAIWTDRGDDGKVQAFKALPPGNIRMTLPGGYLNNPDIYAVLIDQTGTVMTTFTREELVWYVRNPRADPDIYGYGLPELQIAVRLIQAFQNAFDLGADTFCYSADTEVLTSNGWKLFSEVDIETDDFATLDIATHAFEYQKATDLVWKDYEGEMFHMKSRSVDMLVTPNHRIIHGYRPKYNKNDKIEYGISTARELYDKFQLLNTGGRKNYVVPMTSNWVGTEIPDQYFEFGKTIVGGQKEYEKTKIYGGEKDTRVISGDDYCALLGAYLSEGWVCKHGVSSLECRISQRTYSKGYLPFKHLLEKITDGRVNYNEGTSTFIFNWDGLTKHLSAFGKGCYNKVIPDIILDATPRQQMIFWEYFVLGDGATSTNESGGKQTHIATTSKVMADQFQELCQKMGFSATIVTHTADKLDKYTAYIDGRKIKSKSTRYDVYIKTSRAQSMDLIKTEYNGKIGCVSVPNGTLYVRRNGKALWCGNSRNHVPNGMMLLKGVGWVQRQLDILTRVWNNMKSGQTKGWVFPALVVPKDGDINVLDLSDIRGKEVYYQDLMNMSVGAFCTVYRFPPHRLGYKISGKGPDSELPNQTAMERVDEEDIGKEELLDHIELVINEYLLSSKFPHLRFEFSGKNAKADAREYEERQLAMTMRERRANVGLGSLEDAAKESKDEAIIAVGKAMDMAPIDPGVAGIFQALISSQGLTGKGVGPEGRIDPKIDPAESELHGGISGVRRDSAAETKPKP